VFKETQFRDKSTNFMKNKYLSILAFCAFFSCNDEPQPFVIANVNFSEVGSLTIGGTAAAEISAYDPITKRLFVVNNSSKSKVDVVDISDPSNPFVTTSIDVTQFGGGVNSVAVMNGMMAMAIEADIKTNDGKVVVFRTDKLTTPLSVVAVGALPDMVTFSPNARFIVSANEGEPNADYSIDPVGSISIIDVINNFRVATIGFDAFASQQASLVAQGFRVFGPRASFSQDMEPEYVTIEKGSEVAWVTLQENNGIARVDLIKQKVSAIFPLGLKDHSIPGNELDVSDRDNAISLRNWPLLSYYLPDAIDNFSIGANHYLLTANEGDTRDYTGYAEEARVKDLKLDPIKFSTGTDLKKDGALGRYTVTKSAGDVDGDGDFDVLYGIGSRSFTVWDGLTGQKVLDYNKLEKDFIAAVGSKYDDGRSDNKGVEPESIEVGMIDNRTLVFVGLERVDAVMIYELVGVSSFNFLQVLETGDAPEGLLFISAEDSPSLSPLLVVSSEGDGQVKIFNIK
jgi:hypothetical protein